jgi:hypothetical protein
MPRPALATLLVLAACGGSSDAPDAGTTDVDAATGPALPDVVALDVAATPKGDPLTIAITVANAGGPGTVRLTPLVTSTRFADFTDVPLGSVEIALAAGGDTDASLTVGPFITVEADHYALGRGDYTITAVRVELDGAARPDDADFSGGVFAVTESNAVFNAVLYDEAYFDAIGWSDSALAYLTSAFTRSSELFSDAGGGTFTPFPLGFDQMMEIEQHFLPLSGLTASEAAGGFCEQVASQARTMLGLTRDWDTDENQPSHTDANHHGFDLLVGLTPAMGGGAACGWLGVQVSGLFSFDLSLDRSQIILVHETGHLFGAPHCDPLQGYVMCAGEQHDHYQADGVFVWHQVSKDAMSNQWR